MMQRRSALARTALALFFAASLVCAEPGSPAGDPTPTVPAVTGAGQEYSGVVVQPAPDAAAPKTGEPVGITVRPGEIIGPLQKTLFGINYDRQGFEGVLVDRATGKIDPASVELMQGIPLPLNRVGGGDAMRFRWKQAIGPMTERTPMKLWPWAANAKIAAGPVEWIQWLRSIDPAAEVAWGLNIAQDSPQDHADLVRFLTKEEDQGGGDWARRRKELGIEKPIRVAIWEVGNEMDWDSEILMPVDKYIQAARETIAAVRSVDPQAKIAMHALTAPWSPKHKEFSGASWAGWHRAVLKALGPDIDYIAFHPYYYGLPSSEVETYLDRIRDDILQITGEKRIRVYLSEHALWPEMPKNGNWKENWHLTNCLSGTLATSQFLVRCMDRPEITAATYHGLAAGPWWVLNRENGTLCSSGIADMLRLFAKLPEGNVVRVDVSGPGTDVTKPDLNFTAAAVAGANGLSLVAVNRGPAARVASISLGSEYRLRGGWILSGPNAQARNSSADRPIKLEPLPGEAPPFRSLSIPAFSMLVLDLAPASKE